MQWSNITVLFQDFEMQIGVCVFRGTSLWAGLAALSIGMTLLVFSRKDDKSPEHSVIADS
jgi:hypothetical protein